MCSECYLQTCECCEEKAGGRCQDCGGELMWKDTEEEWGEEEEEHSDEYGSSEEEGEDGVYDNGS